MLKHYLRMALRHLKTNRLYSVLNIGGLSLGIAFTLLVSAFIWQQTQVNRTLKNVDQQYIILSHWKNPNQSFELTTAGQLAKDLKERYPGLVENFYRFDGINSTVSVGQKHFNAAVQIGDTALLNMFGFKLLYGQPAAALNHPFQAVITADLSNKLFGSQNALGKTIRLSNMSGEQHGFVITGILDNLKKNSITSLIDNGAGEIFVSTDNLAYFGRNMDWNNMWIPSFITLKKGVNPTDLLAPMKALIAKNTNPAVTGDFTPALSSLKDYYLNANGGTLRKTISTLSFVAIFILFMSIVNFINLSVTSASSRMREIGVRKVMGGFKKQLIAQFLLESTLLVFLATGLAILLYAVFSSLFGLIVGTIMPTLFAFPVYFWAFPVGLALVLGIVAGIYPAFILSGLNVVDSLKSKFRSGRDKQGLRKTLVSFQFITAGIVLICAIIITRQINFFLSKDLGYNKDFIVSAQVARDWSPEGARHMEFIRNSFEKLPGVQDATLSYEIPNGNNGGTANIYRMGMDSSKAISSLMMVTDNHYFSVFQIPLLAGNTFTSNAFDTGKVIINRAAAIALGYGVPGEAVGQPVKIAGDQRIFYIKAVTSDFHFGSMKQKIIPIIISQIGLNNVYRYLSFKIKPENVKETLGDLQKEWSNLMPDTPFDYQFMEDYLIKVYDAEIRLKRAAYTATGLALAIALLSVIGLIALNIQRRTKEIGLRKILGASSNSIILLFLREFVKIILVSGAIAIPVAIICMHNWMTGYAYKAKLSYWPFVLGIMALLICTSVLIIIQTWKTAAASPVKSLKTE